MNAENAALTARISELEAVIAELRVEIEALQQRDDGPHRPSFVKPNTHAQKGGRARKTRRQRAAEHNAGRKREVATAITQIRQHALERCPACQYPLRGQAIARRRQMIDLPPMPAVQVMEHQVIKRWCPVCKKWHTPKLDLSDEVLGQGRIGHRTASLVGWLRTTMRLPVASVRELLKHLYGLTLSTGEIVELAHRVAHAGQTTVRQIKRAIVAHAHAHVHMDETAWREDGDNGYVWARGTTDGLRAYDFTFSRSGQVAQGLLRGFTGTLVTDFYCGYNDTPGQHQRCWVHLLRDLHELGEGEGEGEAHTANYLDVLTWIDQVIQTYRDGKVLAERDPPPTQTQRQALYDTLVERVQVLGRKWASPMDKGHPAHALCKRLLRHDLELFEFVRQPGLAPDNNLAERAVRPLVIARKVSGGTRSERGSDTRMALQTLFATWTAQGKSALDECRAMLAPSTTLLPQI